MSLRFYQVDEAYCEFLRSCDNRVPDVTQVHDKNRRPFVGIVLSINGFNYFAPLYSPKPKHQEMKNQIDFMKINEGKWGVINFNNMIPVNQKHLTKADMKITETDTKPDADYKNLLSNQLSWCNTNDNREKILKNAEKLHSIIVTKKAWPELVKRCCDFLLLEQKYKEYCKAKGIL